MASDGSGAAAVATPAARAFARCRGRRARPPVPHRVLGPGARGPARTGARRPPRSRPERSRAPGSSRCSARKRPVAADDVFVAPTGDPRAFASMVGRYAAASTPVARPTTRCASRHPTPAGLRRRSTRSRPARVSVGPGADPRQRLHQMPGPWLRTLFTSGPTGRMSRSTSGGRSIANSATGSRSSGLSHSAPVLGRDRHRHPVVQRRDRGVGGARDDRERPSPLVGGRVAPRRPQARERQRPAIGAPDQERLPTAAPADTPLQGSGRIVHS